MEPKIKKIQYKGEYKYYILFEDNKEGEINFKSMLWGDVFEPLKNKDYFSKAFVDKTSGTIAWPNGADIAPETIYEKITSEAKSSQ